MEEKILNLLKAETDKMEAQLVIQEVMIDVVNNIQIPGAQAEYIAQQKQFLEGQFDLSKLTLEKLKKLIKEEETNG